MPRGFAGEERREAVEREQRAIRDFEQRMRDMPGAPSSGGPSVGGGGAGMRMNFGGFSGELGAGAPLYLKRGSKNNRVETYIKFLYSIAEL